MRKRAALVRAIEPPRRDLSGSGDYADVKLVSALGSARNALRPPEKEDVGRVQIRYNRQEAAAVGERRQDSRGRPAKNRPRKIDGLSRLAICTARHSRRHLFTRNFGLLQYRRTAT